MEKIYTFCPECGVNVSVDEDGLCISCGATAVGWGVEKLSATLVQLRAENERLQNDLLFQHDLKGFISLDESMFNNRTGPNR